MQTRTGDAGASEEHETEVARRFRAGRLALYRPARPRCADCSMRFEDLLWRLPQFAPPISPFERRVYSSAPIVVVGSKVCACYSAAYRLILFLGKRPRLVAAGESLPRSRARNVAHARLMEAVHWWCWLPLAMAVGAAAWIGTDGLLYGAAVNSLAIMLARLRRSWLHDWRGGLPMRT